MADKFMTERIEKIKEWEVLGFDGYARKFDRTHTSGEARTFCESTQLRDAKVIMEGPESVVRMCGRIINFRSMGKLAFLRIADIDGDFQICLTKNVLGDLLKKSEKILDLGDFAGFEGEFFLTNHGEPTLLVKTFTPLAKTLRPMPEKWAGLSNTEACYRERNLDLMSNRETLNRFVLRSKMLQATREFFAEKKFLEVETPILQAQAGGAMAKVFNTHHNALDHDFVLRIALELDLKRVVGGGLERVFEIGKNFRNEGSDPSHLQEFTMCEWYAAYQDLQTNKEWTEELFHRLCDTVFQKKVFTVMDTEGKETEIDFGQKFAEKRFPDLLKEYADLDMFTATDDEVRTKAKKLGVEKISGVGRANLLDDIYKKTAREQLVQPTFVFDYPEDLKPLARPNGDGTASCFQLVVNGWEIVNSYGELIDPQVQRALLESQAEAKAGGDDEAMEVDEVFLKAMEHGFPPMTGSGFGVDRLMAIFTGQPNLRDVVLFPTMRPEKSHKTPKKETESGNEKSTPSPVNSREISREEKKASPQKIEIGIDRAQAMELLQKHADFALQRHCRYVASSMESLANHFGDTENIDAWYIAGLLHDLDWNQTIECPEHHCGEPLAQIFAEHGVSDEILTIIRSHYDIHGVPQEDFITKSLFACDELSGFAVAVAQMRPTKMMGMSPKSIIKKMKDKRFAAAVSREDMKICESHFDIPVAEFLHILIPDWEAIASEWDLV